MQCCKRRGAAVILLLFLGGLGGCSFRGIRSSFAISGAIPGQGRDKTAFAAALDRAQATTAAANARYASSASKEALIAIAGAIDLTALAIPDDFTRFVRTACAGGQACFVDDGGRPFGWERVAVEFYLQHAQPLFATLDDFFGVPGVREARTVLRDRILDRIAECYPALLVAVDAAKAQDAAKHPVYG
mgnify:CR=1 FL=1